MCRRSGGEPRKREAWQNCLYNELSQENRFPKAWLQRPKDLPLASLPSKSLQLNQAFTLNSATTNIHLLTTKTRFLDLNVCMRSQILSAKAVRVFIKYLIHAYPITDTYNMSYTKSSNMSYYFFLWLCHNSKQCLRIHNFTLPTQTLWLFSNLATTEFFEVFFTHLGPHKRWPGFCFSHKAILKSWNSYFHEQRWKVKEFTIDRIRPEKLYIVPFKMIGKRCWIFFSK